MSMDKFSIEQKIEDLENQLRKLKFDKIIDLQYFEVIYIYL